MSDESSPTTHARRNNEARDRFQAALRALRENAVAAAKALRELDACGHCFYESCASIGELGERMGASAAETRRYLSLGRAIEACPELEGKVVEGVIPIESAAALCPVLSHPQGLKPGESPGSWLEAAEKLSTKQLRVEVDKRIVELREGEVPVVALTVVVAAPVRDDFERARAIASRKLQRPLTGGEALAVVVDHYLDDFDPARVRDGSRRVPHTGSVPGRYVPAVERRKVMARTGDRCAIPYCDHSIFLQNAHIQPHAAGGDREATNLHRLCTEHHLLFDAGKIRASGPADAPVWVDAEGRPLTARQPSRGAPAAPPGPPDPGAGGTPPAGSGPGAGPPGAGPLPPRGSSSPSTSPRRSKPPPSPGP